MRVGVLEWRMEKEKEKDVDHYAVLHCHTPDLERLEELRRMRAIGLRVGG